jgi:hypothetical protein
MRLCFAWPQRARFNALLFPSRESGLASANGVGAGVVQLKQEEWLPNSRKRHQIG